MGFTNKVTQPITDSTFEPNEKTSQIETITKQNNQTEPPFTAYKEIYKQPYTVDYFNIFYFNELTDKTDVNKVRDKVKNLESFIADEIKLRKLDDNISSYKQIIKHVLENIGDSPKDINLLERVNKYISLIQQKRNKDKEFKKMVKERNLDYFFNLGSVNGQ